MGIVSTYPPTRCGIGSFTSSFVTTLHRVAPAIATGIVRLVEQCPQVPSTEQITMEVDPNSMVSMRAAARLLNRFDVVLLQHEYGIYGRNDGENVLALLDRVERPTVVVLHTVLPIPSAHQRRIVEGIHRQAQLVVLSDTARAILASTYGIDRRHVTVIRHGSRWAAQPPNHPPRNRLITWGLLGPGKGLERSIRSVAHLRDLGLEPRYRIVGRTHPEVVRREGFAYRHRLEALVERLGLGGLVEFVDRYLPDGELFDMVRRADLVVVPYDNTDQVSSGVITEALSLGRPVVATRFPYAAEMLDDGAGVAVDHDSEALARAIQALLQDEDRYLEAARVGSRLSTELSWETVTRRYVDLLHRLAPRLATA